MSDSAAPVLTPKTREDQEIKLLPPYHVIIHNDDHHSMEFVIEVLTKVFGYKLEESFTLMMRAHEEGKSVVWTGAKEVAELKAEQITSFHEKREGADLGPLGVSLEPAA
jgi:ATP-dependent Clp protease adaptor protein ClpS